MPEIIMIAALAASNRVIGNHGKLPWHIPEDLQRFKQLTTGHAVIMGRKTWEFGLNKRALPNRLNVVISSSPECYQAHATHESETATVTQLDFVGSIEAALHKTQLFQKVFIIGGASIYAQMLDQVDRLELTLIDGEFVGDAHFPDWQTQMSLSEVSTTRTGFQLIERSVHPGFRFETYQLRIKD
jgi:dihydrofolate reductase